MTDKGVVALVGVHVSQKNAGSSQAAWALLAEGVASARVEAHRLRGQISRAMEIIKVSPERDAVYEAAGDLLIAVPQRVEKMEGILDRTSYALSVLGKDVLRDQLPLSDRKMVDEAVERAKPLFGPNFQKSSRRVADRYLRTADLTPPLGFPGGPCQVVERARGSVHNPRLLDSIEDRVEQGVDLPNADAAKVYPDLDESLPAGHMFRRMLIQSHAQYRMDLRGIPVTAVRAALLAFVKDYRDRKSRDPVRVRGLEEALARAEVIDWTDPRLGLTVVFAPRGRDVSIVSAYWRGEPEEPAPGEGGCDR